MEPPEYEPSVVTTRLNMLFETEMLRL